MNPRLRIYLIVAAAAAAAAALAVGAAVLGSSSTKTATAATPCSRGVPFLPDFGVRTDAQTVALRRAAQLYERSRDDESLRPQARSALDAVGTLEGRVGAALAGPDPAGELGALAASHPHSAFVQLQLGLALYCTGHAAGATAAWRKAARLQPDTVYAVRAGDFLHPDFAPGLPLFVASFTAPPRIRALPPAARLQSLARAAASGSAHAKILYGVALQQLGRPVSARREFALAARQAPNDVEALVADAVGRFDKDRPARAFSRLGPLSRRFPRSASVRFHLGYLLLSIGQVREGKRQLRLAVAAQPSSLLSREAKLLLTRLVKQ